jgi:YidC/Oxa1 family membrane protein insertase
MDNPTLWNQLLVWPIVNVLMALYKFFEYIHVPGPLGFAVIGLTILIRLVLYPLMQAQMKSAKKMSKIKPHMDALNEKHKNDKQALQAAQLALYKEHGVNPAAGCLPILIQMPVLIALYNVFYEVLNNGNAQKVVEGLNQVAYSTALRIDTLDLTFFGINLGLKPAQWQTHGWWLLSIPVITGLLQWYQSKLMLPIPAANPSAATAIADGKKKSNKKALAVKTEVKVEKKPEDTAMEMQKQLMLITPIMFGYFALQFPLGLALYWNVFGVFGIMQQLRVNAEK